MHKIVNPEFSIAYRKLMEADLPIKTAYKLKKMTASITDEQRRYDELRKQLLEKLGEKDDKGELKIENGIVMLGENEEAYVTEHQELLDIDLELPVISVSDLGDAKISVTDLMILDDIVSE